MWKTTYKHVNQNNYWLLVVGSQIGTLTLGPSFGHNLCYKYSNGSYEPILNIFILRTFQWYKELFNPMSFDPWNPYLKIWNSIRILTPQLEVHLGMCGFIPSHSFTLPRVPMWFTFSLHLFMHLPWSQT
jgi:hypothetical protein